MEGVCAGQHDAQCRLPRPWQSDQSLRERGRDEGYGYPMGHEPLPEKLRGTAASFIGNMHACACGEVGPNLPYGGIKSHARQLGCAVRGRHPKRALVPGDKVHQTAMSNFDALRLTGRTRRIDHIC